MFPGIMPDAAQLRALQGDTQKIGRLKKKPRFSFKPRQPRKGETIGGGIIIVRRGKRTDRLRFAMWPFEHGSADGAIAEIEALKADMPDETFEIWTRVVVR